MCIFITFNLHPQRSKFKLTKQWTSPWLNLVCFRRISIAFFETTRLLHSPSLVASGLSVGYATWTPTGWHHPLVTVWSKYGLGLPQSQWIVGSCDRWEFPIFGHWQSPWTALIYNGRQMPAVKAVQGDCERVYETPDVLRSTCQLSRCHIHFGYKTYCHAHDVILNSPTNPLHSHLLLTCQSYSVRDWLHFMAHDHRKPNRHTFDSLKFIRKN